MKKPFLPFLQKPKLLPSRHQMDSNALIVQNMATNDVDNTASENAISVADNTMPNNAVTVGGTTPSAVANSAMNVDKSSNFRWNFPEEDALIDVLVDMVRDGQKNVDNGWNPGVLHKVAMKLRTILGCPTINKGNVNNRLRTCKEKYVLAKEALSLSGFSMTPDGRITGDDIAWETYVQAKPKARSLRYQGVRHYDKLCLIFGADHAHGNLSYEATDDIAMRKLNLDSETPGDTSDDPEFMDVDPDTPTGPDVNDNPPAGGGGTFGDGGQPSGSKSKAQSGQKRCRSLPGYDKFDDSILLMAEVVKEMASAFDKPIMSRLLSALKGIPELSHDDIRRAMIVFGRDRESAEILVSMDESMRYDFVRDMIG